MTTTKNSLHDLTAEELGYLFPIELQDYNDTWKDLFQLEKKRITGFFHQCEIIAVDHIGSTAIPGIKAKPTIDILLQISEQTDVYKLKETFRKLGYQLTPQPDNPPPHITFVRGYTHKGIKGQAYHVHVRFSGDWNEIRFRDYLIKHKEIAKEYEALKSDLARRYKNNRERYTGAKTEWIENINKLTRK